MFEVVYLTGAPASGKSSASRLLRQKVAQLEVFEYGARLTAYLADRRDGNLVQEDLRRQSSGVITLKDVQAVDRQLLDFIAEGRHRSHLLIDSHAVTKEGYGFRVTPYSIEDFRRLAPTQIWVLYASPKATQDRIGKAPEGRPHVTLEEAAMHTSLQASVAATYGIALGLAVHLFDTTGKGSEEVATMLAERLNRAIDRVPA